VIDEIEGGFLKHVANDLFRLLNPELSELDATRAALMSKDELERITGKLSGILPNIVSEKLFLLSVYSMNIRMSNSVNRLFDLQNDISKFGEVHMRDGSGKKAIVAEAGSLGEVKLAAEIHRERMKRMGFKDPEKCPLKLKIAFRPKNEEELAKIRRDKEKLIAQMEIDEILDIDDIVLEGTASQICQDLVSQGYKPRNIAVVGRAKGSTEGLGIPKEVLLIEYQDDVITPEAYSLAIEIMAHKKDPGLLKLYLQGSGIVRDENNPLRFILPKVTKYDVKQLKNEAEQYHKIVIMA
jgi:hypothetical protein